MGKIISITNQKGGVGKTTTAINFSASLAESGMKVLLIDLDPQGNATNGLGVESSDIEYSVYDLLLNECTFNQALIKTEVENLSIIPSDVDLAAIENDLSGNDNYEFVLKSQLLANKAAYDYIIVDCPPALSKLTINALTCSDSIIIPIQCEYFALVGLTQLMETISLVKERLNPKLVIEGIVFTMYDGRANHTVQIVNDVRNNFGHHIFQSLIPRTVRFSEAQSFGIPINLYDKKCVGAAAYRCLASELLTNDGKKEAAKRLLALNMRKKKR